MEYNMRPTPPAVPDGEFGIACDSSLLVHIWREYAGNRVYDNGVLSRLLFDGVYVSLRDSVPTYHYYIRDYLGNNRVVADAHGNVEEVNHYYPYGALMGDSRNTGLQPYKYIGKELDLTHGLDWYAHGARHYAPCPPIPLLNFRLARLRVCGFFRLVTPYVRNKVVPLPYGTDQATTRHSSGCAYRQLRCCKF